MVFAELVPDGCGLKPKAQTKPQFLNPKPYARRPEATRILFCLDTYLVEATRILACLFARPHSHSPQNPRPYRLALYLSIDLRCTRGPRV